MILKYVMPVLLREAQIYCVSQTQFVGINVFERQIWIDVLEKDFLHSSIMAPASRAGDEVPSTAGDIVFESPSEPC